MTRMTIAEVFTLPRIFECAIESGMTQPKKQVHGHSQEIHKGVSPRDWLAWQNDLCGKPLQCLGVGY